MVRGNPSNNEEAIAIVNSVAKITLSHIKRKKGDVADWIGPLEDMIDGDFDHELTGELMSAGLLSLCYVAALERFTPKPGGIHLYDDGYSLYIYNLRPEYVEPDRKNTHLLFGIKLKTPEDTSFENHIITYSMFGVSTFFEEADKFINCFIDDREINPLLI